MPEPKWVKAEGLALNDEIRFKQEIWDVNKEEWTGRSRQIQGRIVNLSQQKVTLWTSEGLMVKKITTIEKGKPERLEGRNESNRQPTVWLREPKKRYVYNPDLDPLVQAIARDNEYDERMKRRRQFECEQGSLPEANAAASKPNEE
jgi:hypothetical protein